MPPAQQQQITLQAAGAAKDGQKGAAQSTVKALPQPQSFNTALDTLNTYLRNARGHVPKSVQAQVAAAIQFAFDNRPLNDADAIGRLMIQLQQIHHTKLVSRNFKRTIEAMYQTLRNDQLRAWGAIK